MKTVIIFTNDQFLTATLTGLLSDCVDLTIFSYNSIENDLFQLEEVAPDLTVVDTKIWSPLSLDICESFDTIVERLKIKTLFLSGDSDTKDSPRGATIVIKPFELLPLKDMMLGLVRENE
jgi:hypothetical protein